MSFNRQKLAIWSLFAIFMISCSSPKYLEEKEKLYKTNGKNYWTFHRLSDRDKGLSLAFPGYIIGIEKAKRKLIGAPSMPYLKNGNALKNFGFDEETYLWDPLPYQKREILDDQKPTFISHIKEFKFENEVVPTIRVNSIYDIYSDENVIPTSVYQNGNSELEKFGETIRLRIKNENITHIFFYVMGWNSGQQEAIRNFNSLFLRIIDQAKSEEEFKPLFVGLTWPSHWNSKWYNLFSFFNKTNDADELGMMWANLFLNREILNEKYNIKAKTVVLGHSFGAKITSRAVMSASMLENKTQPVDLLINLQSAYSINRFSYKGIEKAEDYLNWDNYANHIALVWSQHDKAVTKGFYAPFAGGKKAYKRVSNPRTEKFYPDFEIRKYTDQNPVIFTKPKQLYLIDGSDIIKYNAHYKSGKAHSDIYNDHVGNMVWNLIKSSTIDNNFNKFSEDNISEEDVTDK